MADNLDDANLEYDPERPIYEEETRAYEADLPDQT